MDDFETAIRRTINQFSQETERNTPDFILAQYMLACLNAFNSGVNQRDKWYGAYPRPGMLEICNPEISVRSSESK